jgi:hypothetical protein
MGIPKLRNPNAQSFTHVELQNAMLGTIAAINEFSEEAGVNEVRCSRLVRLLGFNSNDAITTQPSLMNFCVTDGVSVVATRYVCSRNDAAASLVRIPFARPPRPAPPPEAISLTCSPCSGFLLERRLVNMRRVDITKCPRQTSART